MEIFDPTDAPRWPVHDKIPILDDRIVNTNLDAPFKEGPKICLRGVYRWKATNIWAVAPVAKSNPGSRLHN